MYTKCSKGFTLNQVTGRHNNSILYYKGPMWIQN